jgi:hypothetical protein
MRGWSDTLERKIGLIPKVLVNGALGLREYGVLVTDQRTIFVLERKTNAALGGAVGGIVGAIVADALTSSERTFDYENEDLQRLIVDDKNMVVPHSQLQRIRLKKGFSGCFLRMEYSDSAGKRRKVKAILSPPSELVARRKKDGVKRKVVLADYARGAQNVFEHALPASIAQIGEWRI